MPVPDWAGSLFFVFLFGWIISLGTRRVDHVNRLLMVGKLAALAFLFFFGLMHIKPYLLTLSEPRYALFSFPVLIISFGFHNMIPSLTRYMGGDVRRVRNAIIGGALLSLLLYLVWEVITLGLLPHAAIIEAYKTDADAATALRTFLGRSWIGLSGQALAFFAVLTSFLAQSLSLVDFLRDGLKLEQSQGKHIGLCGVALLPPLICSILFPRLFFEALNFAGGLCAVALFGILPVAMAWRGRTLGHARPSSQLVGGKPLLSLLFIASLFIMVYKLTQTLGLEVFPKP